MTMSNEKAVLISDVHFNLNTLDLATRALKAALALSSKKKLPLIVCGDLLDQKSIIRGECANALLDAVKNHDQSIYVLVGNHDLLNEKVKDHSLNFLRPFTTVIDTPRFIKDLGLWFIPYNHDASTVRETLNTIPQGSTVIMHQGLVDADMGHYIQDKSALLQEDVKNHRIISGHYHKRQNIICDRNKDGQIGVFSYVGNPFTLTSAEADDPSKGIQVLIDDGSLDFYPLNFRQHRKFKFHIDDIEFIGDHVNKDDIITITLTGPKHRISIFTKQELGDTILGHNNYKLEIIPDKQISNAMNEIASSRDKAEVIFDRLIDELNESESEKEALKKEWKELLA